MVRHAWLLKKIEKDQRNEETHMFDELLDNKGYVNMTKTAYEKKH